MDLVQPINFDLTYVGPDGTKQRPVVIHRAVYGSLERFFAILLEHYKGHLPFWLSPVQATVLTITDAQHAYAQALTQKLEQAGIRVTIDNSSDPISGKIKRAQLEKIPWMIVVGKKEEEQRMVTLRLADGSQIQGLSWDDLIAKSTSEKH